MHQEKIDAAQVRALCDSARERIAKYHIRTLQNQPGPVLLISATYPGVWLEHAFDAVCYAALNPRDAVAAAVAHNQMRLFLRNQKPDGRLPYKVQDGGIIGYRQIQECVSFARLCFEVYQMTGDEIFLAEAYEKLVKWDEWLCANRMTRGTGLIELFCLFDTGHDNSARLADVPVQCPDEDGKLPVEAAAVPMLAPDMNAVFYGNRMALSDMALALQRPEEALQWSRKAEAVKEAMMRLLYDAEDEFFYDRDASGTLRKFLSISIVNVFTERVLDQALGARIYARHMRNPDAFWTPYPFPSMAICDPGSAHAPEGNSWGFYSQALTALRSMRWMDFYGQSADYDELLRRWVFAMVSHPEKHFTQELHPLTGEPSVCSEWYSSAMLLLLYAAKRLGYER